MPGLSNEPGIFFDYLAIVIALKSFFAFTMSLSLLWAGMGFSVSRHYCLGMLKSESFYTQADYCQEKKSPDHQNNESCSWNCCDEEWLSVAPVEVERTAQKELHLPQPDFLGSNKAAKLLPPTTLYHPLNFSFNLPRPQIDFQAEFQQYLI